ncbi:DUF456 domain-containing protein [Propioniciclava soli]|uniref:DUF456 domain-containing protein n=1 Tax=Propioniciclava soli TaxID=2775081 RepID=A0ABZ3C4K8_9ACTN
MTEQLVAAIAVVLTVVGVCGIVVPVLPGSITALAGLLVWALFGGAGTTGWVVFAVGTLLLAAGASAQLLITGRRLRQRAIPNRSVAVGLVCGVVGLFVIPFVGLPVGFVVGLLAMEWARVRELRTALSTSWAALTSVGLGMVVELACALAAATTLLVGILVHFFV